MGWLWVLLMVWGAALIAFTLGWSLGVTVGRSNSSRPRRYEGEF